MTPGQVDSRAAPGLVPGASIDGVIVVIGQPVPNQTPSGVVAAGLSAWIALAAAETGATVQLVGRVPDDPDGDAVLQSLVAGHVGHVATLRQPPGDAPPILQPADLDLALRYLADLGVLVLADGTDAGLLHVAAEAAAWSGAPLIAILPDGATVPLGMPQSATVLAGPAADPDGAFAAVVGTFAAALDRGDEPGEAFRATLAADGWSPVGRD
jgi:hypothetical protein